MRRALIVLVFLGVMPACAQEQRPRVPSVIAPIASLRVDLDPGSDAIFLERLAHFASATGFEYWTETRTWGLGTTRVFEMSRRDIRIFGSNDVREYGGNIPTTPDGLPDIEIDPTVFYISFYRNETEPDRNAVNRTINEFVQTLEQGDGVSVSLETR